MSGLPFKRVKNGYMIAKNTMNEQEAASMPAGDTEILLSIARTERLSALTSMLFPGKASRTEREALLRRFAPVLTVDPTINRSLISNQSNKRRCFARWFHYKESFSSELVGTLLQRYHPHPGRFLDPFSGAGTAPLAASDLGWDALGMELLPVGITITEAMMATRTVSASEFAATMDMVMSISFASHAQDRSFGHLSITKGAFPRDEERELVGYLEYCDIHLSGPLRVLFRFAAFCVLEEMSYTRKDGQFLRWDNRSERARGVAFRKNGIPPFRTCVSRKLEQMRRDLESGSQAVQPSLFARDEEVLRQQ